MALHVSIIIMIKMFRCRAFGQALDAKFNSNLLALKLDYNASIGDAGLEALSEGLFTNHVLKVSLAVSLVRVLTYKS